jgi:hypothetical protein
MGQILDRLNGFQENYTLPNITLEISNPDYIFESGNESTHGYIGLTIITIISIFSFFVLVNIFKYNFNKANLIVGSINVTLSLIYISAGGFTNFRHFLWIGTHIFFFIVAAFMYKLNLRGE